MVILVVIIFVILGLSDFPIIVRQKRWYEVAVLSGVYVFVFVLTVMQVAGVHLPSPIKAIQYFISDTLHLAYQKQ